MAFDCGAVVFSGDEDPDLRCSEEQTMINENEKANLRISLELLLKLNAVFGLGGGEPVEAKPAVDRKAHCPSHHEREEAL